MKCFDKMKTCLIVDQDAEWCGRAKDYLASHGIETHMAIDEEEAFRRCRDEMPRLVLLSCARPTAFLKTLRRQSGGEDAIVILCGEPGDTETVADAIWHGASDYLVKPYNRELLNAKLRQTGIL
jgi:two-component system chemotaxis response regulator CheY